MVLDLDSKLLQIFIVLQVLVDSFADELGALLSVLLFPCGVVLLVGRLSFLLVVC
jgi:hypothetical protein